MQAGAGPGGGIAALRTATNDIHQRLHGHPAFAPIMAAPPDLLGYARLVGLLHGFHAPVEAWLFAAAPALLPELVDLKQRRKAHLLAADMAALAALAPPPGPPARLEIGGPLSRPALLGCLYVIEGATLGGRTLGRALQPALHEAGIAGHDGTRFFLAYGTRQGEMWRRFCSVLDQAAQGFGADERGAMTRGALGLFLALEEWLTERVVRKEFFSEEKKQSTFANLESGAA